MAADDFLGACYRKAMTPKKLWTFTFSPGPYLTLWLEMLQLIGVVEPPPLPCGPPVGCKCSSMNTARTSITQRSPALVGACLATGDRIFATGSDSVSKIVLRFCGCFCLFSGIQSWIERAPEAQNRLRHQQFAIIFFAPCLYC